MVYSLTYAFNKQWKHTYIELVLNIFYDTDIQKILLIRHF